MRRSRALQRELAGVFPPEPLRAFRDGFKHLQAITGPTRDLDVQLLEFGDLAATLPESEAADVVPLRWLLDGHLRAARAAMVHELGSERTTALLHNWAQVLDGLVASDETGRPDAARPVGAVAGERIAKVYARMVKLGGRIGDDSPAEALHDLRKKGKELRYLLEFFASLYPAGRRQADGRVAQGAAGRPRPLPGPRGAGRAPALARRRRRRARGRRAGAHGDGRARRSACSQTRPPRATSSPASFAAFAAKEQRALVKQTFAP